MRLLFNLEYFGECNNVINFYSSVFNNTSISVKTFKEMPMADVFGITGQRLDMVWQSMLCINYENSLLCMEMSDSLLVAMQKEMDQKWLYYNPVICILHNDEDYIRDLYKRIYGSQSSFESLQNGDISDVHGIRWQYQKSNSCGIYYCLSFNGFCSDVIAYYENAFNIKAAKVIKYINSPYSNKIPAAGADKIYSAIIQFNHGNHTYLLKLCDSIESAMDGIYGYDPNALLFYQGRYNPVFTLKDNDTTYLFDSFKRLMIGAKLNRPMMPADDGSIYGSMIDKYGICWNFHSA